MTVSPPETKKGDFIVNVKPDNQYITLESARLLQPLETFQVYGGSLGGKVVGLGGRAIKGAEIFIDHKRSSGVSNADGRYTL